MAVTGCLRSDVCDAIHQARGNKKTAAGAHWPITGISNKHLLKAMSILGWRVADKTNIPTKQVLYFKDFLTERGNDGGRYIVNVTGHYIAVANGEVCDSGANASKIPIDINRYLTRGKYGYRHAWVRRWWRFQHRERAA